MSKMLVSFLLAGGVLVNVHAQTPHVKIEQQINVIFLPYEQIELSPNIQSLVDERVRQNTYTVRYSENSRENMPLNHALIRVKVFYNGNPKGISTIVTDDKQRFLFSNFEDKSAVVFELVSINGQDQSHLKCIGSSLPGRSYMEVNCK